MTCSHLDLIRGGINASETILREACGLEIRKALNPLKASDYMSIVASLAHDLKGIALPIDNAAMQSAIKALDVDWKSLSPEGSKKIIDAASKYFEYTPHTIQAIDQKLNFAAKDLVKNTKAKTIHAFDLKIDPSFSSIDQRVLHIVSNSQGHFIRDKNGQRKDTFAANARAIVAGGLQRGFGSDQIGEKLHEALGDTVGRSRGYWNMIAMVFANRARTMTQLFSFGEAGIQSYQWESILDQVTSLQCRFMHGRTFSVQNAIQSMHDVEEADSPEAIKTLQPFMNASGGKLYYGSGEDKTHVADVIESGYGTSGKIGKFGNALSTGALDKAGIRFPPLHGHCRSTVIPVEGGSAAPGASAQVPEQIEAPPKKPTLAQAKQKALEDLQTHTESELVKENEIGLKSYEDDPAPYMKLFEDQEQLQEVLELNQISKKPKLEDLHLMSASVFAEDVEMLIKSPKKLDAEVENIQVVKWDNKLYVVRGLGGKGPAAVVAQKLLGQKLTYAKYTDLDSANLKLPAEKPPVHPPVIAPVAIVPPPPPPPPPPVQPATPALAHPPLAVGTADNVLGEKVSNAQGSNEGGMYRGKDGILRYVKFYTDIAQAQSEHLANTIYAALGQRAPKSMMFVHEGKIAYASEIIEGAKTLKDIGLTGALAKQAMHGFAADVLTANWDAAGTGLDNMVVTKDGQLMRIDNGGTFLMRAKAGRKPTAVLNTITEWEKFFDPSCNPYYSKVASAAGVDSAADMSDQLVAQIKHILEVRNAHGGWDGFIAKHVDLASLVRNGMPKDQVSSFMDARKQISEMLEARTTLLEGKLAELTAPKPKKLPMGKPIVTGAKPPPADTENLAIRQMEHLPKRKLPKGVDGTPTGESVGDYRRFAEAQMKKVPLLVKTAISRFTNGDYRVMRAAQRCSTSEEFDALCRSDSSLRSHVGDFLIHKPRANALEEVFKYAKPVPGQVFRGIRNLPKNVVDQLMSQDTIELGGSSSSSRTADIAIEGFMGGTTGSGYRAFFVIHSKSGVAIETISECKSENEVLISGQKKFKVLSRHVASDCAQCLIVEIEEL